MKLNKDYLMKRTYCFYCEEESFIEWFKICKLKNSEKYESTKKTLYHKYIFERLNSYELRDSLEDDVPKIDSLCIGICNNCGNYLVWERGEIVHSRWIEISHPNANLPEICKELYNEARDVYRTSLKSAAGLLRLSIEELLVSLNLGIERRILSLTVKDLIEKQSQGTIEFPKYILDGLAKTCISTNDNLHSGEIDLYESKENVLILFKLVNEIAKEFIDRKQRIRDFNKYL